MKNDPILSSLTNFLIPIIFLYGLFILGEFPEKGFLAVIYAMVFFISGALIYLVRFPNAKISEILNFEYISFFLLLVAGMKVIIGFSLGPKKASSDTICKHSSTRMCAINVANFLLA